MATFSKAAKPSDHFDEKTWAGNGGSQAITGLSFSPDIWWIKSRNGGSGANDREWLAQNSTRGIGKNMHYGASENAAETDTSIITSRDSGGLTLTNDVMINASGDGYIGTFLKAGNASTSSNGDGSITSTVQANTTGGISVVTYTGNATSGATIGHGLGTIPDVIWVKNTDATKDWIGYWHGGNRASQSGSINETDFLAVFHTDAITDQADIWNDTAPTSSVFSVGDSDKTNDSGNLMQAYCFSNRNGILRCGVYQGNGNAHGPFIFTGFKPRAVMIFKYDAGGDNWSWKTSTTMALGPDNAAQSGSGSNHGNAIEHNLKMDLDSTEVASQDKIQFFAQGFSPFTTDGKSNGEGNHYVYIAFADQPSVTTTKLLATAF